MAGDDREPIGRKGRPSRPTKQKVTRRRVREEDYDDEYDDDDYEDEKPVPRKAKGKGGKPRRKRSWLWLLVKLGIVFAVLIAAYGVYLDQKIRSRIDGKVWELPAAVYGRMVNLEPDMQISKNEMVRLLNATQYRQVSAMTRPGEYTVQANSIEMIRLRSISRTVRKGRCARVLPSTATILRPSRIWIITASSVSSASIRVLSPCCSRRTASSACS